MINFGVSIDLNDLGGIALPSVNLVELVNRTFTGLVRFLLGGYGG